MTFRFLERWGGTIATLPIGIQGRFCAEQRESAYLGVAAVTRALRHDLGGCRLAGSGGRWWLRANRRPPNTGAAGCRVRQAPNVRKGRVSRTHRLSTTVRNCTRDEGGPFEFGDQEPISSHRKLLRAKAVVVSVAETPGPDFGRHGRERRAQANRCRSVESGLGDVRTRG